MDARKFFELVRRMRAYQREYFKHKRKSDLQQSKILESKVDEEIKRVEAIVAMPDAIQKQQNITHLWRGCGLYQSISRI